MIRTPLTARQELLTASQGVCEVLGQSMILRYDIVAMEDLKEDGKHAAEFRRIPRRCLRELTAQKGLYVESMNP